MISIGMLWRSKKELDLKANLEIAKKYYTEKYGTVPNACRVNKAMLEKRAEIAGVMVTPVRYIQNNHLWLGQESK